MSKPSDEFMLLTTTESIVGGMVLSLSSPLRQRPGDVNGWQDGVVHVTRSESHGSYHVSVKESAKEIEVEYNRAVEVVRKAGKRDE